MFLQPPAPPLLGKAWVGAGRRVGGRGSQARPEPSPGSRYVVPPTWHFWEYSQAWPSLSQTPSPPPHTVPVPGLRDILQMEKELGVKAQLPTKAA